MSGVFETTKEEPQGTIVWEGAGGQLHLEGFADEPVGPGCTDVFAGARFGFIRSPTGSAALSSKSGELVGLPVVMDVPEGALHDSAAPVQPHYPFNRILVSPLRTPRGYPPGGRARRALGAGGARERATPDLTITSSSVHNSLGHMLAPEDPTKWTLAQTHIAVFPCIPSAASEGIPRNLPGLSALELEEVTMEDLEVGSYGSS